MKDQPDYERKRGNTKLPIEGQFTDDDGDALDISDAVTVEFYLEHQKAGDMSISSEAEIENANQGEVIYHLEPGELGEPGRHIGEFVAIWEDGIKWSAPSGAEFIYVDLHETTDRDLPEAQTGPRDYEVGTLTAETVNTETLEGLSDEELDTLTGPGLSNDNGALTVTAEFEGVEGLTNPLVENVNADGYRITELGEPQDLVDAARLSEVDDVSGDVDALETKTSGLSEDGTVAEFGELTTGELHDSIAFVAPSHPQAYDSIQAAIDNLDTPGTIWVMEDVEETDIVVDRTVTIQGHGGLASSNANVPTLECSGGSGIHLNNYDCGVRNLHIDGGGNSDYGLKVGETGNFIQNLRAENVTVQNCTDGVHLTGYTQTGRLDILSSRNDEAGIRAFGEVDGDWFNDFSGALHTRANGVYGLVVEDGLEFNGNTFHFLGENSDAQWDMAVEESVMFSGNNITGYGWHDNGLKLHGSGGGNFVQGRILRGERDIGDDFRGIFLPGWEENGTGDMRISQTMRQENITLTGPGNNRDERWVHSRHSGASTSETINETFTDLPDADIVEVALRVGSRDGNIDLTMSVDGEGSGYNYITQSSEGITNYEGEVEFLLGTTDFNRAFGTTIRWDTTEELGISDGRFFVSASDQVSGTNEALVSGRCGDAQRAPGQFTIQSSGDVRYRLAIYGIDRMVNQ